MALLVFALCTALVVAMELEFSRFYQRGANILLAEQANASCAAPRIWRRWPLLADHDADRNRDRRGTTCRKSGPRPRSLRPG